MSMQQALVAVSLINDKLIKHECLAALEGVLVDRLAIHKSWGEERSRDVQEIEGLLSQLNRAHAGLFPDPDPEGPEFWGWKAFTLLLTG